jgi:hypothetical protein
MECEGCSEIVLIAHFSAPIKAHCGKKKAPPRELGIFRGSVAEQTKRIKNEKCEVR